MRIKVSIIIEIDEHIDIITGVRTIKGEVQKQLDEDKVSNWTVEILDN